MVPSTLPRLAQAQSHHSLGAARLRVVAADPWHRDAASEGQAAAAVGGDATATLVLQQPDGAGEAVDAASADAVSAASWTRAAVFATAVAGGALLVLSQTRGSDGRLRVDVVRDQLRALGAAAAPALAAGSEGLMRLVRAGAESAAAAAGEAVAALSRKS